MLYIDQFVYANKMRVSHPGERFAFALTTMLITVAVNQPPIHLAVVVIMVAFLTLKAKIPVHVVLTLFSIPITFLVLGVATIAVQINPTASGMLASININNYFVGFTETSMTTAAITLLKSLSAVSCLYFLVLTTPMIEIIQLLKNFRVPPAILDLMMLIYRFIFVFVETALHIYYSQSSRWGYHGFKRSINSFGLLFGNLWAKSFIKSQALLTSLLSRGYEGELNVISPSYCWSKANILLFCLTDLSLLFTALYRGVRF